jgi:(p)ppGpp synthase/HD superfamily hydrolase
MTNEQKNQVAAMNAAGMSIDEILIDTGLDRQTVTDFVAERNALKAKKRGRGYAPSAQTKQAMVEWYQSGHSICATAKKFGVDPKTVKGAISAITGVEVTTKRTAKETTKETVKPTKKPTKEKEPATAATATEPKNESNTVQNNSAPIKNTTNSEKCQALKGVEVIGLLQSTILAIEENFGSCAEIKSLRADSNDAIITFEYGGTEYAVSFGVMV